MWDSSGKPVNGPQNLGSGFMPATYQGIPLMVQMRNPLPTFHALQGLSEARQRWKLSLLQQFNREHIRSRPQQMRDRFGKRLESCSPS
ncbi:MAG: hypothetical protein M2R45_03914 [Verrucomicrobia subdivision 3 bacterium]|nr:hypothetical protein [Limisphaerales bacterium]MCS1417505.1 hypothetical protein [Limisphaerales bacterium]